MSVDDSRSPADHAADAVTAGEGRQVQVDATRPNVARVYDYLLGGKDNFAADRAAAGKVLAVKPDAGRVAAANRAFLRRAVRVVVREGVRQFLDIGSGLPTAANTHEVAQVEDPACRVVYVDHDAVVLVHARALLEGDAWNTIAIDADIEDPPTIFASPRVQKHLDFEQPIAVVCTSVLHFFNASTATALVKAARLLLAPGSHLVISHLTDDGQPDTEAGIRAYTHTTARLYPRGRAFMERVFGGFELLDPGLTSITEWRPDEDTDRFAAPFLGAVGRLR